MRLSAIPLFIPFKEEQRSGSARIMAVILIASAPSISCGAGDRLRWDRRRALSVVVCV